MKIVQKNLNKDVNINEKEKLDNLLFDFIQNDNRVLLIFIWAFTANWRIIKY